MKNLAKAAIATGMLALATAASAGSYEDEPIEVQPEKEKYCNLWFTLASDYVFRGISQTQEDPAAQFDLNCHHPFGPYFDIWASNVDFGDDGNDEVVEVDYTVGFAREFYNVTVDFGYTHFDFPRENEFDQNEIFFGLGNESFLGNIAGKVWWDFEDSNTYVELDYFYRFVNDFIIGGHVGWVSLEEASADDDYVEYKAYIAKEFPEWKDLRFELAFHDTDNSNIPTGAEFDDEDNRRLVGSVTILLL